MPCTKEQLTIGTLVRITALADYEHDAKNNRTWLGRPCKPRCAIVTGIARRYNGRLKIIWESNVFEGHYDTGCREWQPTSAVWVVCWRTKIDSKERYSLLQDVEIL